MASGAAHPVLRFIRQITASGGNADAPDAQFWGRLALQRGFGTA